MTGGTGFLGSALVKQARASGHETLSLDAEERADIVCDVGDPAALGAAVEATQPRAIVHLAAHLTTAADDDPLDAARVNALGTAALFVAAERAGVERVVYASSNAAVGPCRQGSGDATPLDPRSIYGVTKAFGEQLARAMSTRPGAPRYLALRFGWVYGPGRRRGWRDVQQVIEQVIAGERHVRYPDLDAAIDWTWVDDAAAALVQSVERRLPTFAALNVVGDRRLVRDAFAHLQRRYPDLVSEPMTAETPPSGWGLVNDRIFSLLGAVPTTRLEQGLDRMIAAAATVQRNVESP